MPKKVTLNELLNESDIVVLSITASEENKNFFQEKHFKRMKNGAIFINYSRPFLVKEKGLKWALHNKLAGAWYDFVLDFRQPRLVTTDHLGGTTVQSRKKSELLLARKVESYLQTNN